MSEHINNRENTGDLSPAKCGVATNTHSVLSTLSVKEHNGMECSRWTRAPHCTRQMFEKL